MKINKIILKVLIYLIISICFVNNVTAVENEYFKVETKKILGLNEEYNLQEVMNGYLLTKDDNIRYLYQGTEVVNINAEYVAHTQDYEFLYLITKDKDVITLWKINKNNKKSTSIILDIDDVRDIVLIDDELVIVGCHRQDAIIGRYSKELEYLYMYYYGGEGVERFDKIYDYGGVYYLMGTKDAHSKNSPFWDVGSMGEQKVFMTIINKQGIIIDTCYFNHQSESEELVDSNTIDGQFTVRILADEINYVYMLNSNLEKNDYLEYQQEGKSQIILSNTSDLLIIEEQEGLRLKTKKLTKELKIDGVLKYSQMEENVLVIYYYQDYYLWRASIYQYEILNKEDIVINLFNSDFDVNMNMNELSEIQITSYIHNIDVKLDSIEPYFSKQITGKYEAIFQIEVNDKVSFEICNNIIVDEYVNIYEGHTYPTGYTLKFFGYGLLDNKSIVSGIKLNEVGEHTLVISDVQGKNKKIQFKVVDDFYNKEEEYPNTDYTIFQDQQLNILISDTEAYHIKEIFVNNLSVPFQIEDTQITVKCEKFNLPGVYKCVLNRIVYEDETIEVNRHFSVKVLKTAPNISVSEDNQENLSLSIDLNDPDKSLKDIVFEVYCQQELIERCDTNIKNYLLKLGNIQKDKNYNIKGYFYYDLGNGILKRELFMDTSLTSKITEYELIELKVEEDYNAITLIVNTNTSKLSFDKLVIGNYDLKEKYQITENYLPIYISGGISIVVIVVGCGYWFWKKRKNLK